MITDSLSTVPKFSASDKPRAVVVGSGAVGLFLATRLVSQGWRVTVLESGDATLAGFSTDSWRSTGRPHLGVRQGRSRTLGGTSNLWGGQLVEFQPLDFERRPWQAEIYWPISYQEIARYYPSTFELLGVEKLIQSDEPVWDAVVGATPRLNHDLEMFLTRWMKIPSVSVLFADAVDNDPQIAVLPNHTAVGFQGTGNRITGIIARRAGQADQVIEGDCFVVAAGTIETVRLLLAATGGSAFPCPWDGNELLGCYFQDHLGGQLGVIEPLSVKKLQQVFCTLCWHANKFQPKVRLSDSLLKEKCLSSAQGIVAFESSVSEHLVFLKQFLKAALYSRRLTGLGSLVRHAGACARYLPPLMWRYLKDHRVFVPRDSRISLFVQAEQRPLRTSRITIDRDGKDSFGLPRAVLHWDVDGSELGSIRELAVRCAEAFESGGLGRVRIDESLMSSHPRFLDTLVDTYHAAGGAIMGVDSNAGVVDRNLKVFGTSNLYLASAATFPSSSSANVTFTAMTFANRLADHLGHHDA